MNSWLLICIGRLFYKIKFGVKIKRDPLTVELIRNYGFIIIFGVKASGLAS